MTYANESRIQEQLASELCVPTDCIEIRRIENHIVIFRRVDREMWAKLSKDNKSIKKNTARVANY